MKHNSMNAARHTVVIWLTLLAGIVLVAMPSFAARQWTPDDDAITGIPVAGAVTLHSTAMGTGHLSIQLSYPQVKMEQVELNKRVWTLATIDGETRLWETGKPALPVVARAIRLPNTGNVQLVVKGGEYDDYANIDLLPQQLTALQSKTNDFSYDEAAYKTNAWFPSELAQLSNPEILRDARVAVLNMQPVQYNPVTRTLRVYRTIDIETIPIGGVGANELYSTRSHTVPSFAAVYSEILGCDDLFDDARNAPPGQILMICKANVVSTLQPLADWKTQSGRPTQIIIADSSTGTYIKNSIITPAYNSFNPPLEYVLIVGDGGTTATNDYLLGSFLSGGVYTDHSYSQMTTSIVSSIWVSRLSCTSAADLQTHISRTIGYEKTPYMTDTTWFTTGWGYAGVSHNAVSNPSNIRFCLDMMNQRGITNTQFDRHNGNVDTTLIYSRLAAGAIFWAHRAGYTSELTTANLANVQNINKPYIAMNLTYNNADWYGTTTNGIAESQTKLGSAAIPRGALAAIATTSSSTVPALSNAMSSGIFYALGVKNVRQPGPMFFEGKFQVWRNFINDSNNAKTFIYGNNPMGDISVNFWTGVPRTITAIVPTTIGIGQNRLAFQVLQGALPVSGAMVTAWKKNGGGLNETYARGITDETGHIVLTLSNATAGMMVVTINGNQVGQNLYPIVDTVQVVQNSGDLAFRNITIQDDSTGGRIGNNNAVANPGEIIDLSVMLTNRGSLTATGISGTLASNDARITVVTATQTWDSIASTSTGTCLNPFRIHLLGGFTDGEIVPLQITFTTNQGTQIINVPLPVRSARITYVSNNTLAPWNTGGTAQLEIAVQNNGGYALTTPTTATLTSQTFGITVLSPTSQFATLPVGSQSSNSPRWSISSTVTVVPGTQASFKAYFTNGVVSDSVFFTVPVGTRTSADPTGPDGYGYYAYDNSDSLYTVAPSYDWVEVIPAFGGTGTMLPFTDTTITRNAASRDTSTVIHLPFTVRYYGLQYDSATICSNGWLAFGAQPQYNNCLNWNLPAQDGPRNMVAVNWCDQTFNAANQGVYTYSDAAAHQFIITWRDSTLYTPSAEEYQLIIYDPAYYPTPTTDARLKFQYKTFRPAQYSGTGSGASYCTVGIADNTYSRALEICYWNQYAPGSAIIPTSATANHSILFTTNAGVDTSLILLSPNGGDSLAVGFPFDLHWRGRPALPTVSIDVNRNYPSGTWTRILTNTPNDGDELWTVTGPASSNARMRIVSASGTEGDTSAANFVIAVPRLNIIGPNGSEQLSSLEDTVIHWSSSLMSGTVTIQLNRNYPTGTWDTLFTAVNNTGSQSWRPSSPGAAHCRIRILSDLIPTVADSSDSDFTIIGSAFLSVTPNPIIITQLPGDSTRHTVTISNIGDAEYDGFLITTTTSEGYVARETNTQGTGPVYQWYDTNGGFAGPSGNDMVGGPYLLPFPFTFFGVTYYSIWVSTNGFISFTQPLNSEPTSAMLPTALVGPILALYWAPLNPTAGQIMIKTDATNHRVIVAFNGVRTRSSASSIINCEAVFQMDGRVFFEYGNMTGTLNQECIGIQDAIFTECVSMYFHQQVPANDAIVFNLSHAFAFPSATFFMIPANQNANFTMLFDSHNRSLGDTLTGFMSFTGNASNLPLDIPVTMFVGINGVNEGIVLPKKFALEQNHPNPFNPVTEIRFELAKTVPVKLAVYDISGRLVAQLVNGTRSAGSYRVPFDGSRLATGVYFYRLSAGSFTSVKKMVLVK